MKNLRIRDGQKNVYFVCFSDTPISITRDKIALLKEAVVVNQEALIRCNSNSFSRTCSTFFIFHHKIKKCTYNSLHLFYRVKYKFFTGINPENAKGVFSINTIKRK